MNKFLLISLFSLITYPVFAQVTLSPPSPKYGCPYTTQNITIGATNTSGFSIPSGTAITVNVIIKDNTNTNILGSSTQVFSAGFPNGSTQNVTITGVNFAGPMTCNISGTASFTLGIPQSYPLSGTYTVQYPPDLTISESPVGTIAVSTPLDIYSVRYYLNADYSTVNYETALTTYTPGSYGSYTAKAYDPTTSCISVNPSNAVVIKDNQQINFPALTAVTTGAPDFGPGATSSNGSIAITYTSSDPLVATIVSGNIHVVAAGTVTITAHQAGDATHYAAADVSQSLTVTTPTGLPNSLAATVTIYPNPASDIIHVELEGISASNAEMTLTDIMGLKIATVNFENQGNSLSAELPVSHLAEGIYLLHIKSGTSVTCKKITKW